jgi:hypothetical protein
LCGRPPRAGGLRDRTTSRHWVGERGMSSTGAAPFLSAMNGVVCCPTCGLAAIVEGRFRLQSTGEPIGRLRISCINGHGWLLLADRVRQVSSCDDLDVLVGRFDHNAKVTAERSEQVSLGAPGSAPGGAELPVDHCKAGQAE